MNSKRKNSWLVATFLVASLGVIALRAEAHNNNSSNASGAVIIEWNHLAQRYLGGPPFGQARSYAMVHVAMSDAVVAIEGRYKPFRVDTWAPRGASAEAAAAQAAHDVLVFLVPSATATFDAALAADLAAIPPGLRANGVQVGKKVAAAVLVWRANDGFAAANPQPPPFLASELPGIWRQTTAGAAGAAQFSKLGDVLPFGLPSPTRFLPVPPPQLESAQYALDFNEVKSEGRRPDPLSTNKADYSAKQRTALLWAGGGASGGGVTPFVNVTSAFRIWNNVARDVAQADSLSLVETARLFALLTTSIFDSVQTSHTSKFIYRLWRPETAIRTTAPDQDDNNPGTVEDAGWRPLLSTPPYPSHASNMTCIGAGAARMLANVFGTDAKTFTAAWYQNETVTPPATTPPVVHSQAYNSFWTLAQEEGDGRIWGGIHFRFEIDASLDSCSAVADYLYDHYMQPRDNDSR
jgi:hypothetical protein